MTSGRLTLLRPPTSGCRDDAFPTRDGTGQPAASDAAPHTPARVEPLVSSYVSAPGVEPVRIRPLHHRPRHKARYIPSGERFPGLPIADDRALRADLTYADFLRLEPTASSADAPVSAALS